MTTPLLDFKRFPNRRGMGSPLDHTLDAVLTGSSMDESVTVRWARHLHVAAKDILLFPTATEARSAAAHALLAPGDVVLVAGPLPSVWLATVLGAGARYLDVGRRFDGPAPTGGLSRPAAERAAAAHPESIAIVETLTWSGADDVVAIAGLPLRAVIVDATRTDACLGPRLGFGRTAFTLVALRDPDSPSEPVIYALVAPEHHGSVLQSVVGPMTLPSLLADRAMAVLHGLARQPDWTVTMRARLEVRHAQWCEALAGRPGVQLLGRSGLEAAALCLGDDGAQIADDILLDFPSVCAWPMRPMRGLLTADLLR